MVSGFPKPAFCAIATYLLFLCFSIVLPALAVHLDSESKGAESGAVELPLLSNFDFSQLTKQDFINCVVHFPFLQNNRIRKVSLDGVKINAFSYPPFISIRLVGKLKPLASGESTEAEDRYKLYVQTWIWKSNEHCMVMPNDEYSAYALADMGKVPQGTATELVLRTHPTIWANIKRTFRSGLHQRYVDDIFDDPKEHDNSFKLQPDCIHTLNIDVSKYPPTFADSVRAVYSPAHLQLYTHEFNLRLSRLYFHYPCYPLSPKDIQWWYGLSISGSTMKVTVKTTRMTGENKKKKLPEIDLKDMPGIDDTRQTKSRRRESASFDSSAGGRARGGQTDNPSYIESFGYTDSGGYWSVGDVLPELYQAGTETSAQHDVEKETDLEFGGEDWLYDPKLAVI